MPICMRLRLACARLFCVAGAMLIAPGVVCAQGGPPYLTNDPGTPGNANWEINLASMQTISRGIASYEIPQIEAHSRPGRRPANNGTARVRRRNL